MKDSSMQWTQATPTISRLDYIAALMMASSHEYNHEERERAEWAVKTAKLLINLLDKEQQP